MASAAVQAAALAFAPPLDRAIDFTVSEVRSDDAAVLRFTAERRVTFRKTPRGFDAEVETRGVSGDAGHAGRLFEAMTRAQVGRRIVLRLDRAGRVVDIDDLDTLWTAQIDAMATALAKGGDAARIAPAMRLLDPLRAMPRARRVAMIGAILGTIVDGDAPPVGTDRAVSQAARALDGTATTLAGTETVVAGPRGALVHRRDASGRVGDAELRVSLERHIDRATGIVSKAVQTSVTIVGRHRQAVTRSTLIR